MKKRIVIARENEIEPDIRVEKEANSLAKNGFDVIILAWDRREDYKIREDKKALEDCSVRRVSFGEKAGYGESIKSLIPYLKFQYRMLTWLIRNRKCYDICHFCSFHTGLVGMIACKLLRKKYVFDIFDYLSSDASTLFEKIIETLENCIINHADATIICTEERREQIKKTKPKNIVVIHNSPNIEPEFLTTPIITDNRERIRIAYVGILQPYRLLSEILHAVSTMDNIELHIGGFGKLEDEIIEYANTYPNIKYYGRLQYDETLALERSCDIMTAIYDPTIGNHYFAAPNKFYEALCLGKPLIMVKKTGMSNIIKDENFGVLIDYAENGFILGLNELVSKRSEWEQTGERMKHLFVEQYSWKVMEKRLLELYNNI